MSRRHVKALPGRLVDDRRVLWTSNLHVNATNSSRTPAKVLSTCSLKKKNPFFAHHPLPAAFFFISFFSVLPGLRRAA